MVQIGLFKGMDGRIKINKGNCHIIHCSNNLSIESSCRCIKNFKFALRNKKVTMLCCLNIRIRVEQKYLVQIFSTFFVNLSIFSFYLDQALYLNEPQIVNSVLQSYLLIISHG